MKVIKSALVASAAILTVAVAAAGSAAALPEAPVVFRSDETLCYRIPSLQTVGHRLVAVVQARSGHTGAGACSDDGWIDLVARVSADDGRTWSGDLPVVLASDVERLLVDPSSPVYDRSVAEMSPAQRAIRVGEQSLVAADGVLLLLFAARYTVAADCGRDAACVNSPEAVKSGDAAERFFMVRSDDAGATWSAPAPLDSSIRLACHRRFVAPAVSRGIRSGLAPIDGPWWSVDLQRALGSGPSAAPVDELAAMAGLEAEQLSPFLPVLRQLHTSLIRVGPGNAVAFPHAGRTRVVFPTAPVVIWTDDLGATFGCADTLEVTRGSERQIAWLGDGTLLMTLRRIGGVAQGELSRLFSISRDGGETWSRDTYLEVDGRRYLPDAIAQASVVGLAPVRPGEAVHVNLANDALSVRRGGGDTGPSDFRNSLSAVRLFLGDDILAPGTVDGCPAGASEDVAYYRIYEGSAAYASAVVLPDGVTLGVLFEASDEHGEALEYRSWQEALRFTRIPLSAIPGKDPHSWEDCHGR